MRDLEHTLRHFCRLRSNRHLRYVVWVVTAFSIILCLISLQLLNTHSTEDAVQKQKATRGHQYIRKLAELRASAQRPFLASDKENQLWWKSKHSSNASKENQYEDYEVGPAVMLESNKDDYVDYHRGSMYVYTYDHSDEDYPEEISIEGMNRSLFLHQPKARKEGRHSFNRVGHVSASKYKHSLYVEATGRELGEQMFQYAALYGISRLNRRIPVAAGNFSIWNIFRGSTMIKGAEIPSNVTVLMEKAPGVYTEQLTELPETAIQVCCYFHSFKYWSEYKRSVGRQFRFQKEIVTDAYSVMVEYGEKQLARNAALDRATLISVYGKYPPKRTSQFNYVAVYIDLPSSSQRKRGYRAAPASYIHQGMEFYRKEYKHSLFLILSSPRNRQWCKENLNMSDADVLLGDTTSPSLLLATTTLCNNTLITVGPLGWWVGWLNKGKTVYYTNWTLPESEIGGAYNERDYFPADWIGYGDNVELQK